jgi:hypothetical protein
MFKRIIIGIASGYIVKVVQVACNLMLVPFLVSSSVLGLAGYGYMAVLLAAVGLIASGLDGWRLATSRRFGLAKTMGEKIYLPLLLITVLPLLICSVIACYFNQQTLALLGLGQLDNRIISLLMLYLFFEQLNALSEQCFHASAMTWLVNAVVLCEVVLRTACLFYFLSDNGSLQDYFFIFVCFMGCKYLFYIVLLAVNGFVGSLTMQSVKREWPTFFESLPLSLKSLSVFSVFRVTVIFVNRLFSPELAGIYSILMVTIRGYITQLFISVIRPMIIPLTASIDILALNDSRRKLLISTLNSFDFVVILSTVLLAIMSPIWLPLWLPIDVNEFLGLFMLGIIALGLEASTSVKNLLLISQGHGVVLTKVTVLAAISYLFYLVGTTQLLATLTITWLFFGVLAFIVLVSGILIPWLFASKLLRNGSVGLLKSLTYSLITMLTVLVVSTFNLYGLIYLLPASVLLLILYFLLVYNPLNDGYLREKLSNLVSQ